MWSTKVMDVIRALEADNSRSGKETIIFVAYAADRHERNILQRIFQYTYDPHRLYGVIPAFETYIMRAGEKDEPLASDFFELLDQLQAGIAGRREVDCALEDWPADAAMLLFKVLNKDLRCGITEKTINKAIPGTIFEFSPMLCHPYAEKRIRKWPVAVQWKRDGLRSIIKVNKNEVVFLSRKGRTKFAAMPMLEEEVMSLRLRIGWDDMFLDGELTRGSNFNESSSLKSYTSSFDDANLHLFEILTPDEFAGRGTEPWSERQQRMHHASIDMPWIRPELSAICYNDEEVFNEFRRIRALGGEGIIVKQLDGLYYPKRGYEWSKMKGCQTIDLKINGFFEGEGKYKGMLGGFWVEDGAGKTVCKVGGGFSEAQRQEFWIRDNSPNLLGQIIEIEYQDPTPDGSLRNPVFVRLRDDKSEADMVPTA